MKDSVSEWLYGYNSSLHAVDVMDLTKRKFVKRIYLADDGPSQVTRVYQLKVLSQDTVAVMDALKLKLLNSKGEVFSAWNLDFREDDSPYFGYFINYNDARLAYAEEENAFILHFVNESDRDGLYDVQNPSHIFAKLDIGTGGVDFLPVTYPDIIYDRKGHVEETMPNVSIHGELVLYGWPIESNIYTYNLHTRKHATYGGKSNYSENLERFDRPDGVPFRLVGTWFNSTVFNPGNGLYYRTHWGSQPARRDDMTENTAYSKPGYVMLFDGKFRVVDEIQLPGKYWLEDSFLFSEGMGFWVKDTHLTEENILEIGVLEVKVE